MQYVIKCVGINDVHHVRRRLEIKNWLHEHVGTMYVSWMWDSYTYVKLDDPELAIIFKMKYGVP